jgi:hypothetical protein
MTFSLNFTVRIEYNIMERLNLHTHKDVCRPKKRNQGGSFAEGRPQWSDTRGRGVSLQRILAKAGPKMMRTKPKGQDLKSNSEESI